MKFCSSALSRSGRFCRSCIERESILADVLAKEDIWDSRCVWRKLVLVIFVVWKFVREMGGCDWPRAN